MQSWGLSSRFTERDTGLEPSKSGVIGILCAAMGKPRDEDYDETTRAWPSIERLASLRMGVRVDRPGHMGIDFQTAGGGRLGSRSYGVAKADGSKGESVMSWRFYLQDASFLVGLQTDDYQLLLKLHESLAKPVWPVFLGRKAYVPSAPIYLPDGLQEGDLESIFARYPVASNSDGDIPKCIRVVIDHPNAVGSEARGDVPIDFARRRFGLRYVRVGTISMSTSNLSGGN